MPGQRPAPSGRGCRSGTRALAASVRWRWRSQGGRPAGGGGGPGGTRQGAAPEPVLLAPVCSRSRPLVGQSRTGARRSVEGAGWSGGPGAALSPGDHPAWALQGSPRGSASSFTLIPGPGPAFPSIRRFGLCPQLRTSTRSRPATVTCLVCTVIRVGQVTVPGRCEPDGVTVTVRTGWARAGFGGGLMRVWGPGRAAEGSPREVVGVPRPVPGAPCPAGRSTCPGSVHVVRRCDPGCDPRCDRGRDPGRDAGRDRGCDPGRMCGRGGAGGLLGGARRPGSVVATATGPRVGGTDRRGGAMGPRGLAGCPSKASTDTLGGNCRLGLREAGVIRLGRSPERPGRAFPAPRPAPRG